MPTYFYDKPADIHLPKGCKLVGIELLDTAEYLPSFRHPRLAAYILGSERLGLSKNIVSKCDDIIKVPTKFSLNLALTGGIVLYDRLTSMKQFKKRPLM